MSKRSEQEQKAKAYYDNNCICCSLSIVVETFLVGYEQAEEDLALTWEDIAEIDALILEANNEFAVDYSKEISREQFYTEVLNRFNKRKEVK